MFYIVVKFQTPKYNTFRDMNFFSSPDGRKAMHMSPPCISTGGLNEWCYVQWNWIYNAFHGKYIFASWKFGVLGHSECFSQNQGLWVTLRDTLWDMKVSGGTCLWTNVVSAIKRDMSPVLQWLNNQLLGTQSVKEITAHKNFALHNVYRM